MALEINTTRGSDGAMATRTPGSAGYGTPYGDLFAALIRQRMSQQGSRYSAPSGQFSAGGYSQPERLAYQPMMGASAPQGEDVAVGRGSTAGGRSKPLRYSYQFTAPGNSWAGTAPVLPMQTGLQGTEGEDFILEGGDVRALANMSRSGGGGSSPADDPRMRALVAQQEAARRAPAAPIAPVSRGAQSRGARA